MTDAALDLEAMAYHEAGHAVVGLALGYQLLAVYIGGRGTKAGGTWLDRSHKLYTTRTDSSQFTDQDKKDMLHAAAEFAAGMIAERQVLEREPKPAWSDEDKEEISRLAAWHHPGEGDAVEAARADFIDKAVKLAEGLLLGPYNEKVVRLAHLLLEQHRLWGEEVLDLLAWEF